MGVVVQLGQLSNDGREKVLSRAVCRNVQQHLEVKWSDQHSTTSNMSTCEVWRGQRWQYYLAAVEVCGQLHEMLFHLS
jgi:hypothetical protein